MSSDRLSVAVAGLGFGVNHARVLRQTPGARLAAVCDKSAERLSTSTAQTAGAPAYADFREMLAEARPGAVVIATPAALHEEMALAAIGTGCAVLVEKPLSVELDSARRIAMAALAAGVPLMPGHIERFNPAVQELARRVRAGEAGPVLQLSARRTSAIRVPPQDVNVVHDSALHDIDAMRFVLGAEVRDVYASPQTGIVAGSENAILAQLRFEPVSGVEAIGSLEVNWLSPRRLRDLAVLCEKGLYVVDYAAQTLDFYPAPSVRSGPVQGWEASRTAGAPEPVRIAVEPHEQLALELEAFVSAVREGCAMPVKAADGLAAVAVADAITESARSGRVVRPARWSLDD